MKTSCKVIEKSKFIRIYENNEDKCVRVDSSMKEIPKNPGVSIERYLGMKYTFNYYFNGFVYCYKPRSFGHRWENRFYRYKVKPVQAWSVDINYYKEEE